MSVKTKVTVPDGKVAMRPSDIAAEETALDVATVRSAKPSGWPIWNIVDEQGDPADVALATR